LNKRFDEVNTNIEDNEYAISFALNELDGKISEVENKIKVDNESLSQEVYNIANEFTNKVGEINSDIETINTSIDTINTSIGTINTSIETINTNVSSNTAKFAEINTLIDENELVTASAINNLGERIDEVLTIIEDNEYVTALAVTELSDKTLFDIIEMTEESANIEPNNYYKWVNEMSNISVSFKQPSDETTLNNYVFEFTTSASGCTFSVPASIKWVNGEIPLIEGGKTYQVSVVNNLGVVSSFF
jgi:chromosome segregation ATPase